MKPKNLKSKRLKEVRSIWKRQREISKQIYDLGYRELDKPIRHGWYKEIIITENINRYKNKESMIELFNCVQRFYWGRTKELADKKWINRISKNLIYNGLPTITKKQFNHLSINAQLMCTPFYYRTESKKLKLRFYIRIPKGAYKIKFTRAYVTHSKIIDPSLLSEYALLDNKLAKKGYYEAERKLYKYKDYWDFKEHKKDKLKTKKTLNRLKEYPIEEIIKDNISWEIN